MASAQRLDHSGLNVDIQGRVVLRARLSAMEQGGAGQKAVRTAGFMLLQRYAYGASAR